MSEKLTVEIATARRNPFLPQYSRLLLPDDDTLATRGSGKGLRIYDEIERDCHAFSVLDKRKRAVVARPWEVRPGKKTAAGNAAAALVQEQLAGLNFDRLSFDLLDAVLKGYAVAEVLWEVDGARLVARRAVTRDQRRFVFDLDSQPRLLTTENLLEGEELPPRKFLVHAWGSKDANPYGLGLGTRLFWPAWFKRQGITFWLTFADKFGSPTAVGKYPPGTPEEDRSKLLRALEALANDAGVIMPDTVLVELLEAQRSGSIDTYDKLVRYMDEQMSLAVLGEQLTTTPKATGLGSGLADTHNDVRLELARWDADLLSETLNATLVRWIVELNSPGAPLPTVWRIIEAPEDLGARATRDKTITDMGFRPTLDYITETYGGEWEEKPEPQPPLIPPGGALPPATGAAFAEAAAPFPDQAALDAITAPDWAALTAPLFQPIFVALEQGVAPQELVAHMAEWYPQLDDAKLTELLARALFVAEVWGRVNAGRA